MLLKLVNALDEMILPKNFRPSISSYKKRVGISKRLGKDGGVVTGDQMADSRDIVLEWDPVADNDASYITAANQIAGFFRNDLAPFYLHDTDNSRRTEIALKDIANDARSDGLELRIGKGKISLEMLDAHWEDAKENVIENSAVNGNDIISIHNDSDVISYPVIRITPQQFNSDLWIKNLTTGAGFVLGSSSFGPGTEFIIDSKRGTINLNSGTTQVESSAALADGSGFIFLIPGINQIQYQSIYGQVSLTITYRRRYIF